MYYLVVQNLGVERCIHTSKIDQYQNGMSFNCTQDLGFPGGELIREISIICTELPDPPVKAKVFCQ